MLRILIVDDQDSMQTALGLLLEPIRRTWPNSVIQMAKTFKEAIEIVRTLPSPDVVLLDLSLPDSSFEQTIARLGEVSSLCPVVIITGHSEDAMTKNGFMNEVPVVFKDKPLTGNIIVIAITAAIKIFQQREYDRMEANITRMKELAADGPTESR